MATFREVEEKLNTMTDDEFGEFVKQYGGGHETREPVARDFVHHPDRERRLCQLLGLKTEGEKQTEASMESARAAKESAKAAKISATAACVAALVAACSLLVAVIAFFLGRG